MRKFWLEESGFIQVMSIVRSELICVNKSVIIELGFLKSILIIVERVLSCYVFFYVIIHHHTAHTANLKV